MKNQINSGNFFVEHAQVHGNYYGTSYEAIQNIINQNKLCLLDIDVQGVRTIEEKGSLPAIYIFILPSSRAELERRLRGRGTETESQIKTRLNNADKEIEYGQKDGNFDKLVVNDEVERAVGEIESYLGLDKHCNN